MNATRDFLAQGDRRCLPHDVSIYPAFTTCLEQHTSRAVWRFRGLGVIETIRDSHGQVQMMAVTVLRREMHGEGWSHQTILSLA